jgi:hypothetical protein
MIQAHIVCSDSVISARLLQRTVKATQYPMYAYQHATTGRRLETGHPGSWEELYCLLGT